MTGGYSTDFIPVTPGDTIYLNAKLSGQKGMSGYNENKIFNCNLVSAGHSGSKYNVTVANNFKVVVPSNVYYIRASTEDNVQSPIVISTIRSISDSVKSNSSELVGIKNKGSLHDFFLGLGAEYDNSTHSYTYCDNTGLSLDDLIQAYYCTYNWWSAPNSKGVGSGTINVKCIFRPKTYVNTYYNVYNFMQAFNNLGVKIIDLSTTLRVGNSFKVITVSSFDFAFQGSTQIEEIRNVFDVSKCNTIRMSKALAKCKLLLFKNVKTNVNVKDLPSLNKESILFMVTNATPSSSITITLHPDAYSRLIADQDIINALAKQPLISLAEGTA